MKKRTEIKFRARASKAESGGERQSKNVRLFISRALLLLSRGKNSGKIFGFLLLLLLLSNFACESHSLKANSSTPPTPGATEDNLTSFEKDLQTMRNANFDYVFVFRRKDGGAFDAEDKKYLKANSPVFTNRFILTDENKAAIAGSSYKFEPENLEKLQQRFIIENFSKPENRETPDKNSNAGNNQEKKL